MKDMVSFGNTIEKSLSQVLNTQDSYQYILLLTLFDVYCRCWCYIVNWCSGRLKLLTNVITSKLRVRCIDISDYAHVETKLMKT